MNHFTLVWLASLALTFVTVSGAKLCAPHQWESKITYVSMSQSGNYAPRVHKRDIHYYYDETNNRSATFMNKTMGSGADRIATLLHYGSGKSGKSYTWNPDKTHCRVTDLTSGFRPFCISEENTVHVRDRTIGVKDLGGLSVSEYVTTGATRTTKNIVSWGLGGEFIPLRITSFAKTKSYQDMMEKTYYDVKMGIADKSIFDIPEACLKKNK